MSLFINRNVYSYSGGTLVHARECEGRVVRSGQTVGRFAVEASIEWLKVSPDGGTVLIYCDRGTRIWRWRDDFGLEPFAEASNSRDVLGCGFISLNGSVVTVLSKDRTLRGLAAEDRHLFTSNLGSPHSFAPRSLSQLPGNRLALVGSFFSDPYDVAITLSLDELLHKPDAVQQAIRAKAPVRDRAVDVTVGPCDPGAAVVLRDPEDTEVPEEDDQDEDRSDVENFTGVYIRDLDTGILVERHQTTSRAGSGAPIAATRGWIVVQVPGGVDMIRRGTGALRHVPGAILDVWGLQLATVEGNELRSVTPIDSIV